MKKIKVNYHEVPFRLDDNIHPDAVIVLWMQDGIMFVESVDGDAIASFEALQDTEKWLEAMPAYRFYECQEPEVKVAIAKDLADTCIPLPKHISDDTTIYLCLNTDNTLDISSQWHNQLVNADAAIKADFDKI